MEEIKKISTDIKHFAENYFYIISLDKGKTLIKLYKKQEDLIKTMVNKKRVICLSCRQSGKCFCSDMLIKIRNKKTGKIEEISIKNFFERMIKK